MTIDKVEGDGLPKYAQAVRVNFRKFSAIIHNIPLWVSKNAVLFFLWCLEIIQDPACVLDTPKMCPQHLWTICHVEDQTGHMQKVDINHEIISLVLLICVCVFVCFEEPTQWWVGLNPVSVLLSLLLVNLRRDQMKCWVFNPGWSHSRQELYSLFYISSLIFQFFKWMD